MQIKQLFEDEDAVSPVIGVILMVAITVILAAVIGTFVLGLGDQVQNTSPSTSMTFDYSEDTTVSGSDLAQGCNPSCGTLDITHDGGDSIQRSQLSIKDGEGDGPITPNDWPTEVTAGNTESVDVDSSDTVRVVWEASGGGDTSTVGRWTGPDA